MTLKEICDLLNISESKVYELVRKGIIIKLTHGIYEKKSVYIYHDERIERLKIMGKI